MNTGQKGPRSRGCPDIAAPALKTARLGVEIGAILMRPRAMYAKALSLKHSLSRAALAAVALLPFVAHEVRAQAPDPPSVQAEPAQTEPAPTAPAPSIEPATGVVITWEVANRFRLFRDERDFRRHVEAESGRSIFEAEEDLAEASEGRGWARDMVVRLCLDAVGQVVDQCTRDGVRENYLAPADHRIEVRASGEIATGAACTWSFADGDAKPRVINADCDAPVSFRARYGRTTTATVDIAVPGEPIRRAMEDMAVRDLLIAGLGDSVASGDGNPDRPVALTDEGFCFRRFDAARQTEFFRPGRVGFRGDRSCDLGSAADDRDSWALLSARWMGGACHRSLYSHQLRAALGLAIENPHLAVTFLPLACTGATIDVGLLAPQRSRELACGAGVPCPRVSPAQVTQLADLLARARRIQPDRRLDLVFLTVGANDIGFPGLVADIIIDTPNERRIFRGAGIIGSIEASQAKLAGKLPGDFARLRAALATARGQCVRARRLRLLRQSGRSTAAAPVRAAVPASTSIRPSGSAATGWRAPRPSCSRRSCRRSRTSRPARRAAPAAARPKA